MSKKIASLAKFLTAANEQLYDRYINFTLTKDPPLIAGAKGASYIGMGSSPRGTTILTMPKLSKKNDFKVVTPATGIKPSITLTGEIILENTVNMINLTVQNMNANIDTMAYNYITIEAGYMNSGISMTFSGQITNCYMAKPNPNGELVIGATMAKVSELYSQGNIEVEFPTDSVSTYILVSTCVRAICAKYNKLSSDMVISELAQTLPAKWATQTFDVGKSTRHFRSPFACLAWINSLFASYVYGTGYGRGAGGLLSTQTKSDLPPLRLGFDTKGTLKFTSSYNVAKPSCLKSLSCIGSAVLTSTDSATVTAPFNPGIAPGDIVFIDSKYFKTRINIQAVRQDYADMGNLWYVISNKFTFSTQTANMMTLNLVNINNDITAQEG